MTFVVGGMHGNRCGSGPPMLLLHGIGHRWQMWTPLLESLSRDFDVVAIDLPGFGLSPRFPEGVEITLEAAVDLLEAYMDELGWPRAHLVGNSLGGWLALELARRGRAESVCALAPAGLWDPDAIERRLRFWFALWLAGSRRLRPFHGLLRFRAVRTVTMARLFGRPWRIPPRSRSRTCGTSPRRRSRRHSRPARGSASSGVRTSPSPSRWPGRGAIPCSRPSAAPSTSFRPTPGRSCCAGAATSRHGTIRPWFSRPYGPRQPGPARECFPRTASSGSRRAAQHVRSWTTAGTPQPRVHDP